MSNAEYHLGQIVVSSIAAFASILVPIVVAIIGYRIHKSITTFEHSLAESTALVSRRVDLYKELGPYLNDIYCGCFLVGRWRELTPKHLIECKRGADALLFHLCRILECRDVFCLQAIYGNVFRYVWWASQQRTLTSRFRAISRKPRLIMEQRLGRVFSDKTRERNVESRTVQRSRSLESILQK